MSAPDPIGAIDQGATSPVTRTDGESGTEVGDEDEDEGDGGCADATGPVGVLVRVGAVVGAHAVSAKAASAIATRAAMPERAASPLPDPLMTTSRCQCVLSGSSPSAIPARAAARPGRSG